MSTSRFSVDVETSSLSLSSCVVAPLLRRTMPKFSWTRSAFSPFFSSRHLHSIVKVLVLAGLGEGQQEKRIYTSFQKQRTSASLLPSKPWNCGIEPVRLFTRAPCRLSVFGRRKMVQHYSSLMPVAFTIRSQRFSSVAIKRADCKALFGSAGWTPKLLSLVRN